MSKNSLLVIIFDCPRACSTNGRDIPGQLFEAIIKTRRYMHSTALDTENSLYFKFSKCNETHPKSSSYESRVCFVMLANLYVKSKRDIVLFPEVVISQNLGIC